MGVSGVRSVWRGLRVVEHVATGAVICAVMALPVRFVGRRPRWAPDFVSWWHRRLCRAMGVAIHASGEVAAGCLLVSNHVSWLDIPVLGAQGRIGFLSKAEVRDWPLVGWMAAVAGTLFIERGANQTAGVAARIAEGLAQGRTLAIFPEGTTSDGHQVRRFHPRLFAIAQLPGRGIQPVALAYRRGADPEPDASVPFLGEDTLVASLWRILRHPDLVAEVRFLPPIRAAGGQDRRALAAAAQRSIAESLGLPATGERRSPSHNELACGRIPNGAAAPRSPAGRTAPQCESDPEPELSPALAGPG